MKFSTQHKNTQEDFEQFFSDFTNNKITFVYMDFAVLTLLYCASIMAFITAFIFDFPENLLVDGFITLALALYRTYSLSNSKKRAVYKGKTVYSVYCKGMPEYSLDFSENEILYKNEAEEINFFPENFKSIYFTDERIVIYLYSGCPVFIFKSDFESQEKWQEFYDFAKANYCKIKKVYIKKPVAKYHYLLAVLLGLVIVAAIFGKLFFKLFS